MMSNNPFRIYQLSAFTKGTPGLCKQPKSDVDFSVIDAWNPDAVVSLTEAAEFPGITPSLPRRFSTARYDWQHLPIVDFTVPAPKEHGLWQQALARMQTILDRNGKVLLHCKGGRGRSGMVLLKLLVLQGEDARTALARIRNIRAGAVETDAQYHWATKPL